MSREDYLAFLSGHLRHTVDRIERGWLVCGRENHPHGNELVVWRHWLPCVHVVQPRVRPHHEVPDRERERVEQNVLEVLTALHGPAAGVADLEDPLLRAEPSRLRFAV